eukprot:TRINITY_DN123981_c0_g1_i1.p1 TRINITY_DN123981_c0_g1~~TRINITY_DN123981_c0_g1_i1.p1  ORF type:complete len:258 (+),score=33.09 TRINITY_DN123981_c0_g1_i1:119-892(+)
MTNPSGLCQPMPIVNAVAPLFPRGSKYDDRPTMHAIKERQLWPRHIRETDGPRETLREVPGTGLPAQTQPVRHHELRRTAGIKHHLRGMASRQEMMTEYDHNFSYAVKPVGHTSGRHTPDLSCSHTVPLVQDLASQTRGWHPQPWTTMVNSRSLTALDRDPDTYSVRSKASRRSSTSSLKSMPREPNPIWATTADKLKAAKSSGRPLEIEPRGWSGRCWSTTSHPDMIKGLSDKRVSLVQQATIMNLRAPDVPFSTR